MNDRTQRTKHLETFVSLIRMECQTLNLSFCVYLAEMLEKALAEMQQNEKHY